MAYRYWAIIVMLGTLLLAPLALGLEGMPVITRPQTWASLFAIGFVLASAAFITLVWLIPRVGGTTASTITLIAPISSIWLGVVFLSEALLSAHVIGMVVIFLGLLCVDGRLFRVGRKAQPIG
jgi:drug/metabolite transporter (DMT)-like permease